MRFSLKQTDKIAEIIIMKKNCTRKNKHLKRNDKRKVNDVENTAAASTVKT